MSYISLRYFGLVLVSRSHNQNFNGKKLFLAYFGGVFNNLLLQCMAFSKQLTQRTQTSLRRLQDVLKRSRRLTTKQDVVTTTGKKRQIYDVLKTSDLRCLKDVEFTTS